MNPENEHFIKEIIRNYKTLGVLVEAKWDAGGDSCFCGIEVKGSRDYNNNILLLDPYEFLIEEDEKGNILRQDIYIHNEFINELSDYVIATLGLPEVGEIYHNGEGIIDINEENQVFIKFSAKYGHNSYLYDYYNEEKQEWEDLDGILQKVTFYEEIDDKFELRKLLNKAKIQFLGTINRKKEMDTSIKIEVFQGDNVELSPEQSQFYKLIIENQLFRALSEMELQEKNHKKPENQILFESIKLHATLIPQGKIVFEALPSSWYFENFVEEIVILMD